jgi:hypothetical protein
VGLGLKLQRYQNMHILHENVICQGIKEPGSEPMHKTNKRVASACHQKMYKFKTLKIT